MEIDTSDNNKSKSDAPLELQSPPTDTRSALLRRNSDKSDGGGDLGSLDGSGKMREPTLIPSDMKSMSRGEIAWHMANYFIPFDEIESYSMEFSGMLGDLGLYIPIVVLLALNGQIDLGSTLITTGLCNILTGFVFKVPMCVQPMKSIAQVALVEGLSEGEIMAAGIATSGIVMILGMTNLITTFDAMVPKPVVRGLQIGLGLGMFKKGLQMLPGELDPTWGENQWIHWDGYFVAGITLIFCLLTAKSKLVPTAFIVFIVGIVIAGIRMGESGTEWDSALTVMHTVVPTGSEWITGMAKGTLPQVPTTLLNSCIAVCKLSETLYPDRETGLDLRTVSSSVGMMNVVFCWFGGYPMCHGSGGLAGQHRFGARTNLSIIVLGFFKLVLGAFIGTGLLGLLRYFPNGLLAPLLAVASWELSVSGRDGLKGSMDDARLCVLTAAIVTFWGQANGIIIGLLIAYLSMIADAFFGSDEDCEKGRQRLSENKILVVKFFEQSYAWWADLVSGRRGGEQIKQHDEDSGVEDGVAAGGKLTNGV